MKIKNKLNKLYHYYYIWYFRTVILNYIKKIIFKTSDKDYAGTQFITESEFKQCKWTEKNNYFLLWQLYYTGSKDKYYREINAPGINNDVHKLCLKLITIVFFYNKGKNLKLTLTQDKLLISTQPYSILKNLNIISNFNALNILYYYMHISNMNLNNLSISQNSGFWLQYRGLKYFFSSTFIPITTNTEYSFFIELIAYENSKYEIQKSNEDKYNNLFKSK